MTSKTLQHCLNDFSVCAEVNLKNRFHLSSSSRRPKHVKMSTLTLFPERGRCSLIHWDLKLFVLFVLMNNSFVSTGVEVAVVDRKVPNGESMAKI